MKSQKDACTIAIRDSNVHCDYLNILQAGFQNDDYMDEVQLAAGKSIAFNLYEIIEMWNFCMKNKLNASYEIAERLQIESFDVFCIMDDYLEENPSYKENYIKLFAFMREVQERFTGKLWKDADYHNCNIKLTETIWETIESNQWAIPVVNATQNQYRQLDLLDFDHQVLWDMVYKKLHAEYFGAKRKKKYKKIYETKGNPDDYNLDKVLEVLGESGESKVDSKATKKKNKKKKNSKTSKDESVSNSENGVSLISRPSKPVEIDNQNKTIKDSFENQDHKNGKKTLEVPDVKLNDSNLKTKPNKHKSKKKSKSTTGGNSFVNEKTKEPEMSSNRIIDPVQDKVESSIEGLEPIKNVNSDEVETKSLKIPEDVSKVEDYEEMKKNLKLIQESKLCKICLDDEACMVFIPCGHLMSCSNCSSKCKNCAICRRPVQSVIKTYFS